MGSLKDAIQGDAVVNKDGQAVSVDELAKNELIGLYFSAHWCPPCRGFTPVLADCYKKLKAAGKNIEIIFVSSDRDEPSFKEYYNSMPWLALNFADRDRKMQLGEKYGIQGIPSLIFLKPDGSVATSDGRGKVAGDPDGKEFPWGL